MSEISERADDLIEENGHTRKENLEYMRAVYCMHPMVLELLDYISALEAEVEALKPWRDGFDPKVTMPEQGVKVWVAMPYLDTCVYFRALWNVDEWLEVERRSYAWKRDRITRWWPLPEVTK